MEFKNALSILFSNTGYIVQIVVWLMICLLLVAAVGAIVFVPTYNALALDAEVVSAFNGLKDTINNFLDNGTGIKSLVDDFLIGFKNLMAAVAQNSGVLAGLCIGLIFIYVFYVFVSGLAYYPIADIINKIMSSNLKIGLASNLAMCFKNALRYSGARLLVVLPVDALIFGLLFGIGYGLYAAMRIFALPFMLLLSLFIISLRACLLSGWLPRMLFHPEERVFTAFSRSFTFVKSNFRGFFKAYFITFACSYLFSAGFGVVTFGLMTILVPATYYFLLRTVELVGYYKTKGYSFYTDPTTVVETIEYGYRQNNIEDEYDNNTNGDNLK